MPILRPAYYDSFTCTAGECSFTCCQEWNISVDDDTLVHWHHRGISQHAEKMKDCHIISLDSQKRCPHLNAQNLCELVINSGEDDLPDTCRTFPRQSQEFDDRTEFSLVLCCPHVIDLLNELPSFSLSIVNAEVVSILTDFHFDFLFDTREQIINLIQKPQYTISKSLLMVFYDLLKMTDGTRANYSRLSETIDQMNFSFIDSFIEVNELFLDLIENYRKEGRYDSYLTPLANESEKWTNEKSVITLKEKWTDYRTNLREYDTLIRNCLAAEIFTNMLLPDSELEDMIIMTQWIGMEYSVIRHAIFLYCLSHETTTISYETVRDTIVLFSRIMGYDQEDIYDYLENSFQELIWDWGYFALVVGI